MSAQRCRLSSPCDGCSSAAVPWPLRLYRLVRHTLCCSMVCLLTPAALVSGDDNASSWRNRTASTAAADSVPARTISREQTRIKPAPPDQLPDIPALPHPVPAPPLDRPPLPAPDTRQPAPLPPGQVLDQRQQEKELRYRRLQQQLQRILQQRPAGPPETSPAATAEMSSHTSGNSGKAADTDAVVPLPAAPAASQSPPQSPPPPPAPASAAHAATPSAETAQLAPLTTTDSPPQPAHAGTQATGSAGMADAVVSTLSPIDGPIDRLGLANNLYALGDYVMALKMYEEIDQTTLTEQDRFWIEYQTACCLRRLRRIPEAQDRYRRLAAQPSAELLHEMSRWWLDRIADRTALEADLKNVQTTLETLREAENAAVQR